MTIQIDQRLHHKTLQPVRRLSTHILNTLIMFENYGYAKQSLAIPI